VSDTNDVGPGAVGQPLPGDTGVTPATATAGGAGSPGSKQGSGLGFKIATGVLALTTIGGLVWGFTTNKKLDDANTTSQAKISQLQEQVATLSGTDTAQKQQVASARSALKLEKRDLNAEDNSLTSLQSEYAAAQKASAAQAGNLDLKLQATQTQLALTQRCTQVLADSALQLYESPTAVTKAQIATVLNKDAELCKNVVVLTP